MKTASHILAFCLALFLGSVALAGEAKVTLHLLDHTEKKETKERFWIDWCDRWQGVVETKTVTGEVADKIIAQLGKSLLKEESDNLCGHHPIYGIVATQEDGTVFKTSLCFSCGTWVKPKKRLSIAGKHGVNNELCKTLRAIIELPQDVLEGKSTQP